MTVLGLNIRNFGPTATPEHLVGWARFAEEHGFGIAMLSDHVAPTPDVNEIYPAPFYDPFATLSWLAGLTSTLQLGTSVAVLPYRHPLLVARMAANIDRFADGRFVLGVGIGWSEPEYHALGIPFAKRGAVTDEYLAAIIAAWTEDVVSLDGQFADYRDVRTGPRPAQTPHPPVWVGGSSPAAIRRAARFGEAWHPINREPAWLREVGVPSLRVASAEAGRPMPALAPRIRARLTAGDLRERRAGEGSLAQVCADVRELIDLGSTYVVLDPNPDHPRDEKPLADDWRALAAIAERLR
ncbi:TIGR03619 family F420-dependent LLM class oxidoreductase [Allorhizocola rhizosphaerae]|uniref:TIGR03619 family F420-dependent LLM class oxidoreductase n=1 Tax=Allorhizocola rhizosphaerae TaxID=1872709 RepID=UPI000E3BC4BF|nr:TIGR03619 family F420-dependent LLM class oxidoreductase [Allorhizocola rhizosphaerae]